MTVNQLIEHLKTQDPDALVVGFPKTYPIPEGVWKTFDVTWVPGQFKRRGYINIHVPGEPEYRDIVITFI